jgi:hypothetical protein
MRNKKGLYDPTTSTISKAAEGNLCCPGYDKTFEELVT